MLSAATIAKTTREGNYLRSLPDETIAELIRATETKLSAINLHLENPNLTPLTRRGLEIRSWEQIERLITIEAEKIRRRSGRKRNTLRNTKSPAETTAERS